MVNLFEELTTGPLADEIAPHIASGNDGAIYDIMHRRDIPVNGAISTNAFAMWAAKNGQRVVIQDTADDKLDALRSVALTLLDLLRGNLTQGLDLANADNIALADAWAAAGKMTAQQKQSLLDLSSKMISRAEQLGIPCTVADIAQALRG